MPTPPTTLAETAGTSPVIATATANATVRCPRDRGPHPRSYCQHPPRNVRCLLRCAPHRDRRALSIFSHPCIGGGARTQALDAPEG